MELLNKLPIQIRNSRRRHYFDQHLERALGLIVYVGHGKCLYPEDWPYAGHFKDITELWVTKVGHKPRLFRALLEMLKVVGKGFFPEPALSWLNAIVRKAGDPNYIWEESSNGLVLGELLYAVWKEHKASIKANAEDLQVFSGLVDLLVTAGVRVAAVLQNELESGQES